MLALDEAAAVLQVPAPDVVRQGAVVLSSGGEELVPAFQIDHLGQRIWPVVARINAIIDAARDPWAAASWWLSPSGWLDPGVAPADLVTETGADDLLVAIAEGLFDG